MKMESQAVSFQDLHRLTGLLDRVRFDKHIYTEEELDNIADVFGQGYADLCAQDPRQALAEVIEVMGMGDTPDDLAWPTEDGGGALLP